MELKGLLERHKDEIAGVLNCYDRLIMTGTIPGFCFAEGMTAYIKSQGIRIFDYFVKFAQPLRDAIRQNAETLAKENGLEIEFIRKKNFRKEKRVKEILQKRGMQPGLVHIFSAMETCTSYQPWHDKKTGQTYLKYDSGKCLHYYFYFIDKLLGLCYLRVPTWSPFRLQFYFNGHSFLAARLAKRGVEFEQLENAFTRISNFPLANEIAENLLMEKIHRRLDEAAKQYCPVVGKIPVFYRWSIMQAEYATDIVFNKREHLQAFYPALLEILIHSVKPENIATFLGKKLTGHYQGEIASSLQTRILGTRIKYEMGPVSLKMYDKFGLILRIEVTVNDVSFFRQYRDVYRRDGSSERKWTKMKKGLYSLAFLQKLLKSSNERYLEFLSQIETPEAGVVRLEQCTQPKTENGHSYKGFNFFSKQDSYLLRLLLRGEHFITGFTNKMLRQLLSGTNTAKMSRLLKRLRVHGLVKKTASRYKYYLTATGILIATMATKLREMYMIPRLADCYGLPDTKQAKTQR